MSTSPWSRPSNAPRWRANCACSPSGAPRWRRNPSCALSFLLVICLQAGCLESPYAPAPTVTSCGTEEVPCALSCSSSCAAVALNLSTSCMMTLEGKLTPSRTGCDFADGSVVDFSPPLPLESGDLARRSWSLGLRRQDKPCLTVRSEALPWNGGPSPSQTTVEGPSGSIVQEVWGDTADAGAGDLGSRAARRVRLRCPDGKTYAGGGDQLCAGCDGRCVPLVTLRVVRVSTTFEFRLEGGGQVTPLFTCAP